MENTNFGFTGAIPDNVSIQSNIDRAIQYQATHSDWQTLKWFYDVVRNNKDGHLSTDESMDYKDRGQVINIKFAILLAFLHPRGTYG